MREIRLLYRRVNFNSTQAQRGKCESSLMHSLRINTTKTKTLEWQDEFADENLIWRDGKIKKLAHFSENDKLELLHSIAPPRKVSHKKKHQVNRRKYKLKLNKAFESELSKGHENTVSLMHELLAYDDNILIPVAYFEQLKSLDMTRKKQRIKMIETYIKSHNALINSVANENSVFLQEGLFKIPHRWGVGTDIIDKESYITIVRDFILKHFPEYQIEAIVCHHDERGLEEDTGAHSHYFLNGKNNQSGSYDLHKTQIRKVNEFIKQVGNVEDRLPQSAQLNRQQSKVFGEYFQRMFYGFVNERLLNPKGLVAKFADETERRSQQRREMNRQSRLPKGLRSHNLLTRETEMAKIKLDELLAQQQTEAINLSSLQQDSHAEEKNLAFVRIKVKQVSSEFTFLKKQANVKRTEVQSIDAEINGLKLILATFSDKVTVAITNICKSIYVRTAALNRGFEGKAKEYSDNILVNYKQLSSSEGKKIVEAAAKSLDDDLFEVANKNNQLEDGKGFD
jgi:hypothetical protein